MRKIDDKKAKKLLKMLKSVQYYALSTSHESKPQTTIVQPAITLDWRISVFSHVSTKKARNITQNPNVWITVDKTSLFKVPRAIYIEGTAKIKQLTEESFQLFLSHHGWLSKRIFRKHVMKGLDKFVMIEITPRRIITVGLFDRPEKTLSFRLPPVVDR